MSKNDDLYEEAMKAITALFSDQSVSKAECRRNLNTLIGEIQTMMESLGEDDIDIEEE